MQYRPPYIAALTCCGFIFMTPINPSLLPLLCEMCIVYCALYAVIYCGVN